MGWTGKLAIALTVATTGCSSPFGSDEALALAAARERWARRTFADYTFDTRHDCFCPPELVGPVRITVRQGVIVTVTLVATGEAAPADNWYTMEQLFERIPLLGKEDGVKDVTAEYDATLGYPSTVSVQFEKDVLDAGSTYTVSAVGPAL